MTAHMIEISPVMTGESIPAPGGGILATEDLVVLRSAGSLLLFTPEQAYQVGTSLSRAAGQIVNAQIDDDGKPLPLLARLARFASITRGAR